MGGRAMRVREVSLEFKKTVSDGNYGNETYSVAYTAVLDEHDDHGDDAVLMATRAHDVVLERLRASTSEVLRQNLESPAEAEARRDRERDALRRQGYREYSGA